jgi:hypothetical protein
MPHRIQFAFIDEAVIITKLLVMADIAIRDKYDDILFSLHDSSVFIAVRCFVDGNSGSLYAKGDLPADELNYRYWCPIALSLFPGFSVRTGVFVTTRSTFSVSLLVNSLPVPRRAHGDF